MCLIENRKAIQIFKNEFKSSDVQAFQKLLLEQFNFRQQIIQADEKNNEKVCSNIFLL